MTGIRTSNRSSPTSTGKARNVRRAVGEQERFFLCTGPEDREFLFAKPFVKQSWNLGFDAKGRPRIAGSARPSATGTLVWPAIMAATNWWPPRTMRRGSWYSSLVRTPQDLLPVRASQLQERRALRGKRGLLLRAESAVDGVRQGYRRPDRRSALADRPRIGFGEFRVDRRGCALDQGRRRLRRLSRFFPRVRCRHREGLWKVNLGARVRGSPYPSRWTAGSTSRLRRDTRCSCSSCPARDVPLKRRKRK